MLMCFVRAHLYVIVVCTSALVCRRGVYERTRMLCFVRAHLYVIVVCTSTQVCRRGVYEHTRMLMWRTVTVGP